jgi:hypothetical protein
MVGVRRIFLLFLDWLHLRCGIVDASLAEIVVTATSASETSGAMVKTISATTFSVGTVAQPTTRSFRGYEGVRVQRVLESLNVFVTSAVFNTFVTKIVVTTGNAAVPVHPETRRTSMTAPANAIFSVTQPGTRV